MQNLLDRIRSTDVKNRVLHAETAMKSVAVTVISGAALTAHDLLVRTEKIDDLFTPAGWLRLKHNLIYGGLLSVFGLLIRSPMRPSR